MKYTKLPNTDIEVSKICLGTMTMGIMNDETSSIPIMDTAVENGVNFFDTAELYPVPFSLEKYGESERIIGRWMKSKNNRKDIVVGTKIVGPLPFIEGIREPIDFSKKSLKHALHKSLQNLQTDYVDLYQLHWPDRNCNFFGALEFTHNENEAWEDTFQETLHNLEELVKEGKIKSIGVSNESPYGLMRFAEEARKGGMKISTTQNPYSLLNRTDDIGLTEILHREEIGYLAYSPLGFGQLSGKYLNGASPEKGRVTLFPNYKRYHNEQSFKATEAYNEVAKKHGLSLTQMALAFVNDRPFMTSNIIGATSVEQLKENIGSIDIVLSKEILKDIEEVHLTFPNPAP